MNPKASFGNIPQQASESQIPRRVAPGIIRLTLQTSLRSFSASLIKKPREVTRPPGVLN